MTGLPGLVSAALRAMWPIVLLLPAWYYKHPLLFGLRHLETAAWIALAVFALWRWKHWMPAARILFATALLLAGGQELAWRLQREAVLAAGPAMQAVGRHFIVGYTDFAEVAELAEKGLIGGIYVGRRNIRDRSFAEVRAEIAALQERRRWAGLPPLLVAADQEGGRVSHLSPLLDRLPPLAMLAEEPDPGRAARAYGQRQGSALAALGVNLNFSPVVDLKPAGRPDGDLFSDIPARAIGTDPEGVAEIAAGYLDGLSAAGVRGTLKHFPGLRRIDRDTHLHPARLAVSPGEMAGDWLPFRTLAGHAGSAMMLGHVTLEALDPRHAASHSPAVVAGLLRGDWAYDGILLTDDLNMGAVYNLGIGRVAAEALAAGVDLVLVTYDPRQVYRALYGAAAAFEDGRIAAARLAESARRLADFLAAVR
ncbi:glycoside hydrolase family 3 N-terminal domain-containing protein [Pseudothauera nasutitermitis]|uniref:glycoside hydrolase family 3 N-terminal domain-containing protein n=1 Tax=Pseudothauera nasutitermitis TaxID=2565930 RepID=UPI001454E36A|nr:glycoside hydrolase family 3 N-terminal domain-containing protein [Pseudothauera nasutitermitis]